MYYLDYTRKHMQAFLRLFLPLGFAAALHPSNLIQPTKIRLEVPDMGFNYRRERKKFEKEMAENEKRYRPAGMSKRQISAMQEYEEEMLRRERVYGIHTVFEKSKESPGLIELEESNDSYFQNLGNSLSNILNSLVPGLSARRSGRDKEVLLLLARGVNQQETAKRLGVLQPVISKHMKKSKIY